MSLPRRIADNARAVRDVVRGPHPISLLTQPIIDLEATRNFDVPTRELRVGEKNSTKFTGEGGVQQRFNGLGAGVTSGSLVRNGFNQALPGTSVPPGAQNAVLQSMAINGTGRT